MNPEYAEASHPFHSATLERTGITNSTTKADAEVVWILLRDAREELKDLVNAVFRHSGSMIKHHETYVVPVDSRMNFHIVTGRRMP